MNSQESINTKNVTGRRDLHFSNFDELLADVEQLASGEVRTLGNWSFAQVLLHLARSLDSAIDGAPFSFPAPIQWLMSLLMKNRFLTKPLTPGFKLPAKAGKLIPEEVSLAEALEVFRKAIDRSKKQTNRARHGGFGKLTREESDQFHLRHAEMHLSFVVPEPESAGEI